MLKIPLNSPRLEKLRIVFPLNAHVKARQVLGDRTFGVLAATGPMDMLAVFHAIKGVLDQLGIQSDFHTDVGTPVSEKRVKAKLGKYGIPYLRVDGFLFQRAIFLAGDNASSSWRNRPRKPHLLGTNGWRRSWGGRILFRPG
ncbi:MAG TPA: hypothetical protein VHY79_17755 [Rhizomicrobium sp.]|jgi:hypothetical protein|nr:hypothetical protein [Rhizomicrobium sp.]